MFHWHVLYSKPHAEFQVLRALEERGIEAYLPSVPLVRPRPGRPRHRAFFPNYLFAHLDLDAIGVNGVAYTRGLQSLVFCGDQPATVAPGVIAYLRTRLAKELATDERGEILRRGDVVEILDDSFRDMEAVFDERLSAEGRVRVLLQQLETHRYTRGAKREIPLDVDIGLVRKKSSARPFAAMPQRDPR
jgi:transcription antitermination factor NusG